MSKRARTIDGEAVIQTVRVNEPGTRLIVHRVDEAILLRDDDPRRKFAPLTFSHIAVNQGGSHILSHDLGDHIQVCLLNPYAGDDLVKRLALVKLKNLLLPGRSRFHEGEDSDAQGSDESDESSSDE